LAAQSAYFNSYLFSSSEYCKIYYNLIFTLLFEESTANLLHFKVHVSNTVQTVPVLPLMVHLPCLLTVPDQSQAQQGLLSLPVLQSQFPCSGSVDSGLRQWGSEKKSPSCTPGPRNAFGREGQVPQMAARCMRIQEDSGVSQEKSLDYISPLVAPKFSLSLFEG
jgi:hypothetical protein